MLDWSDYNEVKRDEERRAREEEERKRKARQHRRPPKKPKPRKPPKPKLPKPPKPPDKQKNTDDPDTLKNPRTVKTSPDSEFYRHDANIAAEASKLNRNLNDAPMEYKTGDKGDSFIRSSNQFGNEYVNVDTYSDLGVDAVAYDRQHIRNKRPPHKPKPPKVPPEEPPGIPPHNPCEDPPPTISPSSTTIQPGSCVSVTTSGGTTVDVEDTYSDPSTVTVNEIPGGVQVCLSPDATNDNCENIITVTVTDGCDRTSSISITPGVPSSYTAYYSIETSHEIFGPDYPYQGGGCAAAHLGGYCYGLCCMGPVRCDGVRNYSLYGCSYECTGPTSPCNINEPFHAEWVAIMNAKLSGASGYCPPYDVRTPEMKQNGCCPDPNVQ